MRLRARKIKREIGKRRGVGEWVHPMDTLVVEAVVDEVAMHVRSQQRGPQKVPQAELFEVCRRDEAVVVVDLRRFALFQLFCQVLKEGTPTRRRAKRRDEVGLSPVGRIQGDIMSNISAS